MAARHLRANHHNAAAEDDCVGCLAVFMDCFLFALAMLGKLYSPPAISFTGPGFGLLDHTWSLIQLLAQVHPIHDYSVGSHIFQVRHRLPVPSVRCHAHKRCSDELGTATAGHLRSIHQERPDGERSPREVEGGPWI